ncbi:uncharacterized protein N7459_005644 [Penicillium hispanicum]|uniref:uncharacterized protein n=1 Tax=Penicillium hispanicum TaxID=1080232 RepID=UPI00253FF275|nr:uncharacterized protein N7459_005644 [Penicillium hispanicum]KAJ5579659.1 hypothetical protein N7459_005644 [Penicillium hispanicum]
MIRFPAAIPVCSSSTSKDEEKLSDSPTEPDNAQSQYVQDSLESLQQNGDTIVMWYSQDHPDNPYSWSNPPKLWVGKGMALQFLRTPLVIWRKIGINPLLYAQTSADHILLKRAQRLRALTGRSDLKSESEVRHRMMNAREITFFALVKPWEIHVRDPSVLFAVYTALIYGVYYCFFGCFPLAYRGVCGFNLGELSLTFLAVLVGLSVAVI